MSARRKRSVVARTGALAVAAALLASCRELPTAPFEPCALPATSVTPATIEGMSAAHIRAGLDDAANRVVPTLATGKPAAELQSALQRVDRYLVESNGEAACQSLHAAVGALDALPDVPETAADRAGVRLVIEIVSAFADRS